ncbi:MAG: hypothetical protein II115_07055 [Prevotella sp.]|jgi:ribosomal protein L25 (general stress protein Ctc)|nr:hypothetical protein [Prevotella sp.]MBQ5496630.1 hypothetical protein [Prevotella sp.]
MKQTIITALLAPSIGIMASISDEAYLVKAFDTQRNDYKNKLIHDLGISIGVTMFAQAQNLIKNATVPVSFSKSDFADTIKIKVMDGAVVIPVEIAGKTRNLLFDTGSVEDS